MGDKADTRLGATKAQWKTAVDEKDFAAAKDYLELNYPEDVVLRTINCLRRAELKTKKAKDIIRASGNEYLPQDDLHVQKNLKKIKEGKPMSPIVLVVDPNHNRLVIADGYHRACAIYNHDYDQEVPCLMVTLPVKSQQVAEPWSPTKDQLRLWNGDQGGPLLA